MVEIAERTYQRTEQATCEGSKIVFQNTRHIIDEVRREVWQRPNDIPYRQPKEVINLLKSLKRHSTAPRKVIDNTDRIIAKGHAPFYSNGGLTGEPRNFALRTAQALCEDKKARIKIIYQRGKMDDKKFRARLMKLERVWISIIADIDPDRVRSIRDTVTQRPKIINNL